MNNIIEFISDDNLKTIAEKVCSHERLTMEDGVFLFEYPKIFETALLADYVRKNKVGDFAHYGNNLNINHTNICDLRCPICAFSKDKGDAGAYTMTLSDIFNKIKKYKDYGIEEIHIVGGVNHSISSSYLEEMFSGIKAINPSFHIQALTAVEYDYVAEKEKLPLCKLFEKLKKAGLGSIPGGGAEIFDSSVRQIVAPKKISAQRWLEVMKEAHLQGIRTNATMLYGHVENFAHRIDHMIRLRELQDATGGFLTFVPLTFHPYNTELYDRVKYRTGIYDILKVIAVSRLMLDNFDHIKALWMYMGKEFIQTALHFGADDLGSTSIEEKIVKAAGGHNENLLDNEDFERLIKGAGRVPKRVASGYC